jgi:hypothetical protein
MQVTQDKHTQPTSIIELPYAPQYCLISRTIDVVKPGNGGVIGSTDWERLLADDFEARRFFADNLLYISQSLKHVVAEPVHLVIPICQMFSSSHRTS